MHGYTAFASSHQCSYDLYKTTAITLNLGEIAFAEIDQELRPSGLYDN